MIRLTRSVALPRLGALRQFFALRQPGFRAYVMRLKGMSYEAVDRPRAKKANFRNDLTLVLDADKGKAWRLHPVHVAGADRRPANDASYEPASGRFVIPPRSAVVYVLD